MARRRRMTISRALGIPQARRRNRAMVRNLFRVPTPKRLFHPARRRRRGSAIRAIGNIFTALLGSRPRYR